MAPSSEIKTVLVRAPNWIGDQILAYPFFYYLRKKYPSASITSVCVEWVADLQFLNLVDEVFVLPKPRSHGLLNRFRTVNEGAEKLKEKTWDMSYSLPNSFSAAWLLYRAGAKIRRGYQTEFRGFLLNDGLKWDSNPNRHRAQAYADLLPAQLSKIDDVRDFWGRWPENDLDDFIPGEVGGFEPEKAWPKTKVVEPPTDPYWVLAPGATASSRRWPLEKFAKLAEILREKTGQKDVGAVVVGGPKEAPLVSELNTLAGFKFLDFTARGPVTGLWKIFRNAQFTVVNESGLAHMASLCGSPVQIVIGAADPRRTKPLGPGKVQTTINAVDCWPCEKNFCRQPPEKFIQCLRGIHPDQVWKEIEDGFRNPQAG